MSGAEDRARAGGVARPVRDPEFQSLMAALGEAKAAYDQVVRDVSVVEQPGGRFSIAGDLRERWREASRDLRAADDAMLALLDRADT